MSTAGTIMSYNVSVASEINFLDDRNVAHIYRFLDALNFCQAKQKEGEYDNQSDRESVCLLSQIRNNLAEVHSNRVVMVFEETCSPLDPFTSSSESSIKTSQLNKMISAQNVTLVGSALDIKFL